MLRQPLDGAALNDRRALAGGESRPGTSSLPVVPVGGADEAAAAPRPARVYTNELYSKLPPAAAAQDRPLSPYAPASSRAAPRPASRFGVERGAASPPPAAAAAAAAGSPGSPGARPAVPALDLSSLRRSPAAAASQAAHAAPPKPALAALAEASPPHGAAKFDFLHSDADPRPATAAAPVPGDPVAAKLGAARAARPATAAASSFSIKAQYAAAAAAAGAPGAAAPHAAPAFAARSHEASAAPAPVAAIPALPRTAPPAPPPQSTASAAAPATPPPPPPPRLATPLAAALAAHGIAAGAFVAATGTPLGAAPAAPAGLAPPEAGEILAAAGAAEPGAAAATARLASAAAAPAPPELRAFLCAPGPADRPLQCRVVRARRGLQLLPWAPDFEYRLLLEGGEGGGPGALLVARRRRGGAYAVALAGGGGGGGEVLAAVRPNFLGTEFAVDDAGAGGGPPAELAAAAYAPNVLGARGPRRLTVVLPKLAPGGGAPLALRPGARGGGALLARYRRYSLGPLAVLVNRPPRWSAALGAYCLNFGGRVTQASVKNFQLASADAPDRVVLQFGRVGPDAFSLDYAWPLSAVQAFALALTSLHSKLACE